MLLLQGGNLNPKSVQCVNVKSKINEDSCVLFRIDCLSSQRSVIHAVHAVFKDEPNGDFQLTPLSTCSCEDGSLFCSHLLAFLEMIGLVQEASSQKGFEQCYPTRTELLQAVPMLIENMVTVDKFRRQKAQRERREKESARKEKKRKIASVGAVGNLK